MDKKVLILVPIKWKRSTDEKSEVIYTDWRHVEEIMEEISKAGMRPILLGGKVEEEDYIGDSDDGIVYPFRVSEDDEE